MINKYIRFMPIAQSIAAMSKYSGTRVGALALGPGYEIRSTGWNGAPRGCMADEDLRVGDRDERLAWAVHAEANLVANAARSGTSLHNCAMIITAAPCMTCAKLIVQAGIHTVVYPEPIGEFAERWAVEMAQARRLFDECKVRYVSLATLKE